MNAKQLMEVIADSAMYGNLDKLGLDTNDRVKVTEKVVSEKVVVCDVVVWPGEGRPYQFVVTAVGPGPKTEDGLHVR